jgi:hypothetical protein
MINSSVFLSFSHRCRLSLFCREFSRNNNTTHQGLTHHNSIDINYAHSFAPSVGLLNSHACRWSRMCHLPFSFAYRAFVDTSVRFVIDGFHEFTCFLISLRIDLSFRFFLVLDIVSLCLLPRLVFLFLVFCYPKILVFVMSIFMPTHRPL